ncbi:MAG TPA: aminoacyl--tRNA ligase-related protein [Candidatus Saccharimonadales bacterium]|nr:aminoacyl--tRNA ligase-related protein [Candidatus Saccharimonadales bacterium]
MRRSQLFLRTSKNVPADETAKNAQLLIRAGYIYKVMAGVYAYTPLGLRVVENIKQIVREEMNAIAGQELIMTNLQPRDIWEETGRWDDKVVDIWFKTRLKDGQEIGLAWSHEEPIVEMMKQFVASYKDLPISVYQFQTKLRNELRAKSGIMRGREFVMKDMYSLSADAAQHDRFYNGVIDAYKKIYDRLGIGQDTYVTFASGGAFTKFSHEFQTVCEAGEDVIYLHRGKNIAINEEVLDDENLKQLGIARDELEEVKSSEVGNIFNFGTDKSEQMDFAFTDEKGERRFVHLGSYGIGITRVMGVIAEKFADDRGLVWPAAVAPFQVYLVRLGDASAVTRQADKLYESLTRAGVPVLYDDRDARAGEKFADADLLGIPYRVVVSDKTHAAGTFELKARSATEHPEQVSEAKLHKILGITQ